MIVTIVIISIILHYRPTMCYTSLAINDNERGKKFHNILKYNKIKVYQFSIHHDY